MGRPAITWITPFVPDRHGGGGQIRQAYLLRALADAADVDLYSNQDLKDPMVQEAVSSFHQSGSPVTRRSARSTWARRTRDLAIVLYGREPREVFEFRKLREALASVVSDSDADGIVIEYAGLAPLIAYRTRRDTPWILTLHNVGSVMERQEQALYGGGRRAWLHRRDAKIWERWESCVPAGYDLLVAVSPDDAAYFNERTGRLPAVIPNGVDTDRFHMTDVPKHPKLIFTGALNTGPNYYGLLWFCREIWPLIQRDHPAATFDVVGSNAPPQILDLRRLPGVTVHVDVPDIVPYLRDARVSVVPLKIGTGTRLKALEAMAAGRPIVGTSVGLGGLEISAGVHAEIADDPKSFSERVCRLLSDDGYAAVLTQAARQLVEERYSWSAIGADYVTLVTRALR